MSRDKSKPVTVQFVPDEDVDFRANLLLKTPCFKSKKSLGDRKNHVEVSSKKISNSGESTRSSQSRSSNHLAKAPFSERERFRKTAVTVETNENKFELRTPEKRRRISETEENSCEDFESMPNRSVPEFNICDTVTPRRTSKRIQSLNENNKSARYSQLITESRESKRYALRSRPKISADLSEKFCDDESSGSASEENSSSEPEEISSKIPLNAFNSQNTSQKTNSNSISTLSRKTLQKSNFIRNATGLSTPKSERLTNMKQLETPAAVRKNMTKKFAAMSRKMESDEESNSADESVSSSYETEDSTDNKEDSDSSDSEMETIRRKTSNLNRNILGKKKTIDVDFPYKVDADGYFLSKCSKEPTSNNQLSSLEVSHLEEDEIKSLLRNEYTKHAIHTDLLIHKYKSEFSKWLFYLKENFNLLMYGLGSKIELLECFHSEILATHNVLIIHGYFPRLLVKDILNVLITDVLKISAPKNASEALLVIESTLLSRKSPVFIIIHNVDRLICRQRKHQSIISKLASFPNLHLIVSIDHINAPLLWGNSILTELNLVWMNITTYQPYVNETSFENLIYLNETGTDFVSLSSLRNIFKPLASRVKKIFQIIAKERLENANNRQYKGMSYEEWYHRAKADFLVNNITVFKVQLTELIDHGIIKINDHQCIPILVKLDVLEKFYKEMYGNEEE